MAEPDVRTTFDLLHPAEEGWTKSHLLDDDTGEMDFPDCDRKIEIGGRYVKVQTVPCDITVYFHRDRETGKPYLVIDVDNESDEDEPLLMKLYRNDAPAYVEGLDYRT